MSASRNHHSLYMPPINTHNKTAPSSAPVFMANSSKSPNEVNCEHVSSPFTNQNETKKSHISPNFRTKNIDEEKSNVDVTLNGTSNKNSTHAVRNSTNQPQQLSDSFIITGQHQLISPNHVVETCTPNHVLETCAAQDISTENVHATCSPGQAVLIPHEEAEKVQDLSSLQNVSNESQKIDTSHTQDTSQISDLNISDAYISCEETDKPSWKSFKAYKLDNTRVNRNQFIKKVKNQEILVFDSENKTVPLSVILDLHAKIGDPDFISIKEEEFSAKKLLLRKE